jgi:hypothetical protein
LLGAAGEALGYDRLLKTNTAKHRIHSLFRQGWLLYDLIPNMRDGWAAPADPALFRNAAATTDLRGRFRAGLINEGSREGFGTMEHLHLAGRLAGSESVLARPVTVAGIPYGFVHRGGDDGGLFRLGDQAGVIPRSLGMGWRSP